MSAVFRYGLLIAILAGCSGSDDSSSDRTSRQTAPAVVQEQPSPPHPVQSQADTIDATVRRPPAPAVIPPPVVEKPLQKPPQDVPRYGVQIGAYKQADIAQRVANQARSRFPVRLQQVLDRETEVTKVYLGEFMTKDDARRFRDNIVRQFPGEYDDAWVSEIPRQ